MIITFCGHSDFFSTLQDEERLLQLLEEVAQDNPIDFYLGGYGNFDRFALKCAKRYKKIHANATLIFITPYLGEWLNERKDLLQSSYDKIVYPELEHVPQKFAIVKRNEWMIKKADHVFCYVERHRGGAYQTLLYAHKHKKRFTNLYQGKFEIY